MARYIVPSAGWRLPLVSILLSGAFMALCWPYLTAPVAYPEFVTGPHSWPGIPKNRDAIMFQGGTAAFLVIYLVLNILCLRSVERHRVSRETLDALFDVALACLTPALGMALVSPGSLSAPHAWFAVSVLTCAFLPALAFRRRAVTAEHARHMVYAVFGAMMLSAFSGFAWGQFLSFLLPDIVARIPRLMYAAVLGPPCIMAAALLAMVGFSPADRIEKHLSRALLAGQVSLPLLYLSVMPPRLGHLGKPLDYPFPVLLFLVLAIIAAAAWGSLLRKARLTGGAFSGLLSVPCLAAIAVFAGAETRRVPSLWTDDFHLGEIILPWVQWMDFGKVPFLEFFPFHGFMHLTSGALNALFFDGTIGRYLDTMGILFALSAALTYWTVHRVSGPVTALWCAVMALPQTFYMSRMMFLVPGFLFLAHRPLVARPAAWLVSWIAVSALLVLYNTVSGASFGFATLPFALWQTWRAFREKPAAVIRIGVVCVLAAVAVFSVPLTRSMAWGFLEFIVENRHAYEATRGKPWAMSFGSTPFDRGLLSLSWLYEAVRFAWVGVMAAAVAVFLYCFRGRRKVDFTLVYLTAGTGLLLYMFKMYAIQRIDPGSPTRTGSLSYIAVIFLLPVMLSEVRPRSGGLLRFVLLGLLAGVFTGFMNLPDRTAWQNLFWKTYRSVEVSPSLARLDEYIPDIPRAGRIFTDTGRIDAIRRFRSALDRAVSPGSTYFDLSNRQSYYVFADRPVPVRYAAHASAVNALQQRKILEQLKENPPPAVFLDPMMVVDNRVNFRSYYLFRYVLFNYAPVDIDGHTFLVNSNSPAFAARMTGDEAVETLTRLYARNDLMNLPAGWGRSWDGLRSKAVSVSKLDSVMNETDRLSLAPASGTVAGADADLLVLEFSGDAPPDAAAELSWISERGARPRPVLFRLSGGRAVVPLGAYPDWLLARRVDRIELRLPPSVDVTEAGLWRRDEIGDL